MDGQFTIREIGQKIGMKHPISVMDVRTQDELDGWIFADMVEYFEDDQRNFQVKSSQHNGSGSSSSPKSPSSSPNGGSKRKTRPRTLQRVLNQISLEFSMTPFAKYVKSPKFVRDIDWIDNVWPQERRRQQDYPRVQYYCLTSTAGCFTDFHIDFGGTSVWYHILSGRKVFLLIPPNKNNVKLYEAWLCRKDQNDIFFPDMKGVDEETGAEIVVVDCARMVLEEGQTFIIPTGWIHAVYTPVDSLVLGGNFLHGLDIKGQLDIHCLETRTRVPSRFRFPSFVQLMFYAGKEYFKRLKEPHKFGMVHGEELGALGELVNALRSWDIGPGGDADRFGSIAHVGLQCVAELSTLYGDSIATIGDICEGLENEIKKWKENGGPGRNIEGVLASTQLKPKLKLSIKRKLPATTSASYATESPISAIQKSTMNSKPKLHLKIRSALNTSILEDAESKGDDDNHSDSEEDEFPQLTSYHDKDIAAKSTVPRGGFTDLISKQNAVEDDEWLPEARNDRKKETLPFMVRSTKIQNEQGAPSFQEIHNKKKTKLRPSLQKKRNKGTSRSRLMKKLKF